MAPESLPKWKAASKRIQDGYTAAPHDCTSVAIRLLLVFKNIKQTSCFESTDLDEMIAFLNSQLQEKNETLINTFTEEQVLEMDVGDDTYENHTIDLIKDLYTRKSAGFIDFTNTDPDELGHVVAFLYNFAEDTLDFYEKTDSNMIVYTSIGADNQDDSIFDLFFNFYSDKHNCVFTGIYETKPTGVGGSKKCRKCGLPKY